MTESTESHGEIVVRVPNRVAFEGTYALKQYLPIYGTEFMEQEVGLTREDLKRFVDTSDTSCFESMLDEEFGSETDASDVFQTIMDSMPIISRELPMDEVLHLEEEQCIDAYLEARTQLLSRGNDSDGI